MRKVALLLPIIGLALPFLVTSPAQAQAARTWISGLGDDAAPCNRTAPCKTFAHAISVTAPGGEINCLDGGSFGAVTITVSITISCETGTAGIAASSGGSGISIGAATTDVVTLRGLDIDGLGVGLFGILVNQAKEVHIEKCLVRNFRFNTGSSAIRTASTSDTNIFLFVVDTVISDNSNGISLAGPSGFKVASVKNAIVTGSTFDGVGLTTNGNYANVTESIISGNGGSAVRVGASASIANIDRTTMANNAVALNAGASGATIRAVGNNIFDNTTAFAIAGGATIATDGQNRTGGNAGGQDANASLTLK